MKTFKRWTTSIFSSFDTIIDKVENHEAQIAAAIRQAQENSSRARIRLNRVKKDGIAMRNQLSNLSQAVEAWNKRATESAKNDKDKALECLKRRNQARTEFTLLKEESIRHEKLEQQLVTDLQQIDSRIQELKRKKNTYAARESRSKAIASTQLEESVIIDDLENIFERWEVKLGETGEYTEDTTDSLEASFLEEEEKQALESELEALLKDAE